MLNSVSISWLLPSLQQKNAERNTSPQKSSGFDRRSVQSFIPRPRATEHCQQTFHWNHIKPLLFPHFCTLSALPLTLSISLCLFISLLLYPLLPLSICFYPPSLFCLSSSSPLALWGFSVSVAGGFSSFFKPLCLFLPPRTWQQSGNLLSCSLFVLVSPPTWHAVKLWLDVKMSTRYTKITENYIFQLDFVSEDILTRQGWTHHKT